MLHQPLNVHRNDDLPPQAWLFHLSDKADLYCGENVEVREGAFFEGAWSGPLGNFDFANCSEVFGSGAVYTSGGWLFVPPSHTLEAVYLLRLKSGACVASNSIAFIKHFVNVRFLATDKKLIRSFVSIIRGIDNSPCSIPCSNGEFHLLHHHNALFGPRGLTVQPKMTPSDFDDFASYRNYLLNAIRTVAGNASDPARRTAYKLLATVSSGYDSPACAALARYAGCTEAITFVNAREGDSDDGSEIAKALQLNVIKFRRADVGGETRESAAEFFATGMQAQDIVFEELRGQLAKRVFVTGFHGDKIWDLHGKSNPVLARGDISGSSIGEFRLASGFIHVPLPFIGALCHASIARISKSSEMKAFSIGRGYYDRPIPRRIAEEAGISRHAFGQTKKAIVILVFRNQAFLKNEIRSEIQRTLKARSIFPRLAYRVRSAIYTSERILFEFFLRSSRLLPRGRDLYRRIFSNMLWMGRFPPYIEHSHPFNVLAFEWSLSVVARRYTRVQRDVTIKEP